MLLADAANPSLPGWIILTITGFMIVLGVIIVWMASKP